MSCFFAIAEQACPAGAEADGNFAFTLETTKFRLPNIRWSYDVSPPPPPPINFPVYQKLMEADPHGFARVKQQLDDLFPSLNNVATSSMGASIKQHLADYDMPPEAITRAFLSSVHMQQDSLGARVIESKHTGRWRFACLELFNFLNEYTSPGLASKAVAEGREVPRVDHSGVWDRNAFLYAMIEVENSMGLGRDNHRLVGDDYLGTFSALEMYDEICGYGNADADGPAGWRVAYKAYPGRGDGWTQLNQPLGYPTPAFNRPAPVWPGQTSDDSISATDIASFAPIVGYGSLETLQSMKMSRLHYCDTSFAPEDPEKAVGCDSNLGGTFKRSLKERADHSPFSMQRDQWCNPDAILSVESVVGNPLNHQFHLYDTPIKHASYVNHVRVHALDRGEEFIDGTYKQLNLMSWVYVTSSGDVNVRAGMHRLRDLPVFRSTPCKQLPNVQCSKTTQADTRANALAGVWSFFSPWFFRPAPAIIAPKRLNDWSGYPLIDEAGTGAHSEFVRGREALVMHRCSDAVAVAVGYFECQHVPYRSSDPIEALALTGCLAGDLLLESNPIAYSSSYFYDRLGFAPSPPPPPPPPAPNPPPPPPSPSPAPSPPRLFDPDEVKAQIREAEERVCTSVYYLSQTTRCEQLAVDLTSRLLIHWSPPPQPPPAAPIAPNSPPPPPSPSLPHGLELVTLSTATLSTMRMPLLRLGNSDTVDNYYTDNAALSTHVASEQRGRRACVAVNSPLGCITGQLAERCISGERRCGTDYNNALNPSLDATFKVPAGYYVWGVRIALPNNQQLAELFVGTKTLQLFGPGATPIACVEGDSKVVGVPANREIDVICQAPTATDEDIRVLGTVDRLRLTLTGEYRQIWLASIKPIVRDLAAAEVDKSAPPPPDVAPTAPPSPAAPGTSPCAFQAGVHIVSRETAMESISKTHEPCGLTSDECCLHAVENGAQAFQIDDSGCCDLLHYSVAPAVAAGSSEAGRWSADAGFGTVS